jgi:hypothetical protein
MVHSAFWGECAFSKFTCSFFIDSFSFKMFRAPVVERWQAFLFAFVK